MNIPIIRKIYLKKKESVIRNKYKRREGLTTEGLKWVTDSIRVEIKRMKKSSINPMPEYFEKYINHVGDVELSEAFANSIRVLETLDTELLTRLDGKRYAHGKWTVKGILQHIIDWERILPQRALLFARKINMTPPNIDETLLADNMNAERRTIDGLLCELKIARASTKEMFDSFDDEMLLNQGTNWKYEMSVLAMGFTIIGHQSHHLNIIEEKYYPLLDSR